jgi:hypothetical protein
VTLESLSELLGKFSAYTVALLAVLAAIVGDPFSIQLNGATRFVLLGAGLSVIAASFLSTLRTSFKPDGTYTNVGRGATAVANVGGLALFVAMAIGATVLKVSDDEPSILEELERNIAAYLEVARDPALDPHSQQLAIYSSCNEVPSIHDRSLRALADHECRTLLAAQLKPAIAAESLAALLAADGN